MINLYKFERGESSDLLEKAGDFGTGLLRIGLGSTVHVTQTKRGDIYQTQSYSLISRISALGLSVLLLPVTLAASAAGFAAYHFSGSRKGKNAEFKKVQEGEAKLQARLRQVLEKRDALIREKGSAIHQVFGDILAKNIPGYVDVKVDPDFVSDDKVKAAFAALEEEIQAHIDRHGVWGAVNDSLIEAKTRYLKMRDAVKYQKYQRQGDPNPPLEMPLSSKTAIDALKLPKPGKPITKIPADLYRYDHPRDSDEGSPMAAIFGNIHTSPSWKSALDYVQANVLKKPLKECTADELFQMIIQVHTQINGGPAPLRDEYMLVTDPRHCESSFDSIKAYLGQSQDAQNLLKRISRFEEKMYRWQSMEAAARYLTPKEWDALGQAVFLPSSPINLEAKGKEFLQKAVKVMHNNEYHPYQVAAYLHYGLTTLHLFGDGNGRLSRLIANIYLMQHGLEPFYVVKDRAYTQINNEKNYDIAFCRFLQSNSKLMKTSAEQGEEDQGCQVQ